MYIKPLKIIKNELNNNFNFKLKILTFWANIILIYFYHVFSTVATLREDLILIILIEYILETTWCKYS